MLPDEIVCDGGAGRSSSRENNAVNAVTIVVAPSPTALNAVATVAPPSETALSSDEKLESSATSPPATILFRSYIVEQNFSVFNAITFDTLLSDIATQYYYNKCEFCTY